MFRFFYTLPKPSEKIKLIAGAGINFAIVGYSIYWRKKYVDDVYAKMPLHKQREIYENCPSQKYGSNTDIISAINERIHTLNPQLHQDDLPRKPFR